jgi:hypothetical protein
VTARAEKAVRLVTASLIAFVFGLIAVIRDSEPFAWVAVGIVLAAILVGPLVAPRLTGGPRGRPGR